MELPAHKCGLYLTHNAYKDVHQSIEKAVADIDAETTTTWISLEERERSLASGDIWDLQWYPNTPVGFYRRIASTLEAVLDIKD